MKENQLQAQVKTSTKLISARLHFTTGPHRQNPQRKWTTQKLVIKHNTISGAAPSAEATAWYIDVTDERKTLISSEVMVPETK